MSESPLIVALSETVEIRTAQRDRALVLLEKLDKLIPGTTNLDHTAQQTLRAVDSLLVEVGLRKRPAERVWVDRICTCTKLADGTNARHVNPACVVHGGSL